MKLPKLIFTIISIIAYVGILSACTAKPSPTPAPDTLAIKILPAFDVQFIQTSARQDGEYVVVNGQVKRTVTGGKSVIAGHVDVGIIDKTGNAICKAVANYSPKSIPERSGMTSSFTTRIPITAPKESFVSIKFHNGPHPAI